MEHTEFHATLINNEYMEDTFIIAFGDKGPPKKYFVIEKQVNFDEQDKRLGMDTYSFELNSQGKSSYGGIEEFVLDQDKIIVTLSDDLSKRFNVPKKFAITFEMNEEQYSRAKETFENIFSGENYFYANDFKVKQKKKM